MLPFRVFRGWKLEETMTLASVFSAEGYTTAAFLNNMQLTTERRFDQGFDVYRLFASIRDEQFLDNAIQWLSEEREEPFLLWLHFLSPHSPYDYRGISRHLYDSSYKGTYKVTTTNKFDTDQENDIARIRSLYDGEVYYLDYLFGRFLDNLKSMGFLESSVIVLTSDHGEEFKERGGFLHTRVTEEVIRIPLIIYHPAIRKGSRTARPFSNIDILPTMATLANVPFDSSSIDGVAMLGEYSETRAVVSTSMTDKEYRAISIQEGNLKLIVECHPKAKYSLFDLEANPDETEDLVTTQQDRASELFKKLSQISRGNPCLAMDNAVQGVSSEAGLDAETVESLRALGYMDDLSAAVRIEPNPVKVCDGSFQVEVSIHWQAPEAESNVEIRIDRADGKLFASGGKTGSARTGAWARNGMSFYLVEKGTGKVLAIETLRFTRSGCPTD
jgi:arylsulfatase A-like enzyme